MIFDPLYLIVIAVGGLLSLWASMKVKGTFSRFSQFTTRGGLTGAEVGVSNLDNIYTAVPEIWAEWVFSDTVVTPLLKARHGDSSGVRGAAWLGRQGS